MGFEKTVFLRVEKVTSPSFHVRKDKRVLKAAHFAKEKITNYQLITKKGGVLI